jgi:hypothetical protein
MFRLSRRLTAALLWIAIALLPLRGVAAAVMPVAMSGMGASAIGVPADDVLQALPCHGATAGDAGHANAVPADTSHTCAMCDLCHTNVAQTAPPSISLPTLHEALPHTVAPSAIEPRAPDGLFRPPRTFLA